jgi:hydroxymethylglutaryl-CoA reductase (NADPH)
MTTDFSRLHRHLRYLENVHDDEDLLDRLAPDPSPLPPQVPRGEDADDLEQRWAIVDDADARAEIADGRSVAAAESVRRNIENYIGTVKVPVGLAGPLRVNGMFAQGDYYIPLATTEAALVASYNRGARVVSEAGGCTTVLANEGVSRAPGFAFADLREASSFLIWAMRNTSQLRNAARATTRHGKLVDIKFNLEGNHVYFLFEFVTSDASGQNMATIATEAMCAFIRENSPIQPRFYFTESNYSGDKKATSQSFQSVRGRKVSAEVLIPRRLVLERLHVSPEAVSRYSQFSTVACHLTGSIGTQGHYANGLSALYLACGQDVACVAESAVGITRFETTDEGDLRLCVTMPNLMVATVGGGTGLASQSACLDILGLKGSGHAHAFAEVAAALCLAGELSIASAICAHEFASAHARLARGAASNPESLEARR